MNTSALAICVTCAFAMAGLATVSGCQTPDYRGQEDIVTDEGLGLDRDLSETQKWERVRAAAERSMAYRPDPGAPVEEYIIIGLMVGGPYSIELLRHYPEITRRLPFRAEHIESLGSLLDVERRWRWGGRRAGGLHVTNVVEEPIGVLAHRWLQILVGRDFESKAEFEEWYRSSREKLQWRPELGRFVVEGAQSS